jgi:hypothetical protein
MKRTVKRQYFSVRDSSYSVGPLSDNVLLLPSFTPPNLGDGGLNRAVFPLKIFLKTLRRIINL